MLRMSTHTVPTSTDSCADRERGGGWGRGAFVPAGRGMLPRPRSRKGLPGVRASFQPSKEAGTEEWAIISRLSFPLPANCEQGAGA